MAADDSVRAVLITGTGRAFCVGQDLAEHLESLRGNAATSLNVVVEEYNPLILALAGLRVPVVVAINGACAGAGLGMALAGDLRIAAAGAKFTTAFTGIGLSSDSALASRLVHCVGGSRATQLLLTPDPFTRRDRRAVGAGAPRRPAGAPASETSQLVSPGTRVTAMTVSCPVTILVQPLIRPCLGHLVHFGAVGSYEPQTLCTRRRPPRKRDPVPSWRPCRVLVVGPGSDGRRAFARRLGQPCDLDHQLRRVVRGAVGEGQAGAVRSPGRCRG